MTATRSAGRAVRDVMSMKIKPAWLTAGVGSILAVATVAGFGDALWWRLEPFSHFRMQYLAALVVAVVAAVILRKWQQVAAFSVFLAVNAAVILALFFPRPAPAPADAPTVRIAIANVHTDNMRRALVRDFLEQSGADIVLLEEIDGRWLSALDEVVTSYSFRKVCPREDNFGMALLSNVPLGEARIAYIGDAGVPSIFAVADIDGKTLSILATHPLPPGGSEYVALRNEQLDRVAEFARGVKGPVVVCGDLNATPYCYRFRRFIAESGLIDSARGRGPLNTWPTMLPPLRIPIDHCLHTSGVAVVSRTRGPNVGSDHFPLIVEVALTD